MAAPDRPPGSYCPDRFTTRRTVATRIAPSDFDDMCRLNRDPLVAATTSADGRPIPDEETRARMERAMAQWTERGYGMFVARDLYDGSLIGRVGLRATELDGEPEDELAYSITPARWGRGLATELGAALVELAFTMLGKERLVCYALVGNARSRAVMARVGFRYERDFEHVGLPHALSRLSRADWLSARSCSSASVSATAPARSTLAY